jgi:2-polyprenyl-3-methyl-5-hydroxy-6-metoxy-1,4-benzoquinol methylase
MSTLANDQFTIHFPDEAVAPSRQDEEYFELEMDGRRRRIRFHDYDAIYSIPGLYERIFAETLMCRSPQVVVDLLHKTLQDQGLRPADLRVLDFGAGNGMVGEELARVGVEAITGVDQLEEAKLAADRDRPGIYDAYYAGDITDLDHDSQRSLEDADFNSLTCVAALGFGDIPPDAFRAALGLVADGGWVAFNVRDRFLKTLDESGFAALLEEMTTSGELTEHARLRYPHRLGLSGETLHYVAVVAQKSDAAG